MQAPQIHYLYFLFFSSTLPSPCFTLLAQQEFRKEAWVLFSVPPRPSVIARLSETYPQACQCASRVQLALCEDFLSALPLLIIQRLGGKLYFTRGAFQSKPSVIINMTSGRPSSHLTTFCIFLLFFSFGALTVEGA